MRGYLCCWKEPHYVAEARGGGGGTFIFRLLRCSSFFSSLLRPEWLPKKGFVISLAGMSANHSVSIVTLSRLFLLRQSGKLNALRTNLVTL
jgi:hypothetical protein